MTNYRTTKDQHVNGFGGHQIISYAGKCVSCGRKVYAIADAATPDDKADPDPRGHIDAYHARRTISASEFEEIYSQYRTGNLISLNFYAVPATNANSRHEQIK